MGCLCYEYCYEKVFITLFTAENVLRIILIYCRNREKEHLRNKLREWGLTPEEAKCFKQLKAVKYVSFEKFVKFSLLHFLCIYVCIEM